MAIETLGDLHHVCQLCGGSCQGAFVRLLGGEEERIRHVARLLDVKDPIVSGRLRLDGGRCAFLGQDNLCRIHGAFGAEAKPTVCRQYPVIAIRVGDDIRVGLDPGCYTSIGTWQDGPLVEDSALVATPVPLPDGQDAAEDRIVELLDDPRASVALAIAVLCGAGPVDGLPPGFAGRLVTRLQKSGLDLLLEGRDTAPMMRRSLEPVSRALMSWDPANPPPSSLPPASEAFALDAVRRLVWLRLLHNIPVVHGAALLALSGAVACGWATSDDAAFGRAFAAWCRALRADVFWQALTPDAATMGWLARGDSA